MGRTLPVVLAAVAAVATACTAVPAPTPTTQAPSRTTTAPTTAAPGPTVTTTTLAPELEPDIGFAELWLDGFYPRDMVWAKGSLWVLAEEQPIRPFTRPRKRGVLLRIDANSGEILAKTRLRDRPIALEVAQGTVWVGHHEPARLTRFDADGADDLGLSLPTATLHDIITVGDNVWASADDRSLFRVDARSGEVTATARAPGSSAWNLAASPDALWLAVRNHGIVRIDNATAEVTNWKRDNVRWVLPIHTSVYLFGSGGRQTSISEITLPDEVGPATTVAGPPVDRVVGAHLLTPAGTVLRLDTGPRLTPVASVRFSRSERLVSLGSEVWTLDDDTGRIARLEFLPPPSESPPDLESLIAPPVGFENNAWGWEPLDLPSPLPGPTTVNVWAGDELIMWGPRVGETSGVRGVAWHPDTDTIRDIAPAPETLDEPSWVAVDGGFVAWDGSLSLRYDRRSDSWSVLRPWPFSVRNEVVVRAGDQLIDMQLGKTWDVSTGEIGSIAKPPEVGDRAVAVVHGNIALVLPDGHRYDIVRDEWLEALAVPLWPHSVAAAATGDSVVAVDGLHRAIEINLVSGDWRWLPELPIRFFECGASVQVVGEQRLAPSCSGFSVWDAGLGAWRPIAVPGSSYSAALTPQHLVAVRWTNHRPGHFAVRIEDIPDRVPLAVGLGALSLPDGYAFVGSSGMGDIDSVDVAGPGSVSCSVESHYIGGGPGAFVSSFVRAGGEVREVTRWIDGVESPVVFAKAGTYDEDAHAVIVLGTSDVVDIACNDAEAVELLATRLSPQN